MTTFKHNASQLVEEAIGNHREEWMRRRLAPPVSYHLPPRLFDAMAARTGARIEFGERQPDLSREECVTLYFAHGATRVYLARSGVADGEIGIKELVDGRSAAVRCIMCGTAVTPGSLIGNTLANGAAPAMVEHAMKATRLHTDRTDGLEIDLKQARELYERDHEGIALASAASALLTDVARGG